MCFPTSYGPCSVSKHGVHSYRVVVFMIKNPTQFEQGEAPSFFFANKFKSVSNVTAKYTVKKQSERSKESLNFKTRVLKRYAVLFVQL